MRDVGRFNHRPIRSVESYKAEIDALRVKIGESKDLLALKANANWPVMEKILRNEIAETEKRGRLANPLSEQGAFVVIFNDGFITALELFLNLPDLKAQEVQQGGLETRLENTIAEVNSTYRTNNNQGE